MPDDMARLEAQLERGRRFLANLRMEWQPFNGEMYAVEDNPALKEINIPKYDDYYTALKPATKALSGPLDVTCQHCNRSDIRLWRNMTFSKRDGYGGFLLCTWCAMQEAEMPSQVFRFPKEEFTLTTHIGVWIPAIPYSPLEYITEENLRLKQADANFRYQMGNWLKLPF